MSYTRTNIKFLERDLKIGRYLFVSKIPIKRQLLEIKGIGIKWLNMYFHINNFKNCIAADMPERMANEIKNLLENNVSTKVDQNSKKSGSR